MTSCNDLLVQALADGELREADAAAVRVHLGRCRACRATLANALYVDGLAEAFGVPARDRKGRTAEVKARQTPRRLFGVAGGEEGEPGWRRRDGRLRWLAAPALGTALAVVVFLILALTRKTALQEAPLEVGSPGAMVFDAGLAQGPATAAP